MADEGAIAGTGEEQAQVVVADAVEPGADADPTAVAAADNQSDVDGSETPPVDETPADLEALWQRYPALREQHEAKLQERENAGANRREAQLKLEAGRKEQTTANVRRFLADQGVEVEDPGRLAYFYDLAAANAAHELAAAIPEAVLRSYQLAPETREQAIAAREAGDWDTYISTYINGAVEAGLEARMSDYRKQVDAEKEQWKKDEIKAIRAEHAPKRDGALPTPSGTPGAGGPTLAEIDAMPTEVFLSRYPTAEERSRVIQQAREQARLQPTGAR